MPAREDGPRQIGRRQLLALAAGALLLAPGCNDDPPEVWVNLSRRRDEPEPERESELRFAIGTMISPRDSLEDYQGVANYLQARLNRRVRIVQRRGYAETNALLARGEVDFAFISTGPFVDCRRAGASLLAVPLRDGQPVCRSLIIVRVDDPANSFEDLRGSSFAFADPLSFTGRIYPESLVSKSNPDGGAFFERTVFTHSHSDSIAMVADSRIRAAAVEDIVFEYLKRRYPERVAGLRVLHASPPFPGPPFVSRPGLPEAIRSELQRTLLGMHQDAEGKRVLVSLGFNQLVSLPESAYDEVAELHDRVLGSGPESVR